MADKTVETEITTKGADKAAKEIKKVSLSLKSVATSAGAGATAVLTFGGAVAGLIDSVAGAVDEMNTLAGASGLSVDRIKGLSIIARSANKELSQIVPVNLAKRMREVQQGSKLATEAFGDLGLKAADLENMTVDEAFDRVLDASLRIQDPGKRAGLLFQLLGENGRQLGSALKGGSAELAHFTEVGRTLGTDVGPAADKATSSWFNATAKLSLAFEDLVANIQPLTGAAADGLSDFTTLASFAFTAIAEQLKTVAVRMNKLLTGQWGDLFKDVTENGTGLKNSFDAAWESGLKLNQAFRELPKSDGAKAVLNDGPDSFAGGMRRITATAGEAAEAVQEFGAAYEAPHDVIMRNHLNQQRAAEEALEAERKRIEEELEAAKAANDERMRLFDEERQARREAAEEQQALQRQSANHAIGFARTTTGAIINELAEREGASRGAALAAFRFNQADAVSNIAISTYEAVMASMQLGPIAGPIAAAAMVALGATQAGLVLSEQPAFHIGHRAADEMPAMLRTRERVITPLGVDTATNEAVANLNAGVSSNPGPIGIVMDNRVVGYAHQVQMRDRRSPMSRSMRKSRGKPLGRR